MVDVDPRPGPFDYLVGQLDLRVGSLVRVPLGGRRVRGVVVGFPDQPGAARLRPVAQVLGRGPAGDEVLLALARWVAWYHVTPLPVVLRRLVGDRLPDAWTPPAGPGSGYRALLADAGPKPGLDLRPHGGGRAAVFARRPERDPIVLHDPLDPSHRETAMPTFHTLDVADARARLEQVPLFVVARLPGVRARLLADQQERVAPAQDRRVAWPLVEVVDRSQEPPGEGGLAPRTLRAVRETVAAGGRVFLFHNRVGSARALRCRGCGRLRLCRHCGAALGRDAGGGLTCRRCGQPPALVCERCSTAATRPLGRGTAGLVSELESLVPGVAVARVDRESDGPPDREQVVVGTQAAFGLGLRAALAVVVDLDSLELAPRYEAAEEAVWLSAEAARVAGPRRDGGRTLVQTHRPRSLVVQALVRGDSARLDEAEVEVRRAAGLPPCADLLAVTGPEEILALVAADMPEAPLTLAEGRLLLSGPDLDPWRAALRAALDRHRRPGTRLRVEVDPPS